jgi:hypothetical protein
MKYLDTIGNEFIKGTSKDIILAFDDDGHSRWEINESGLISLYLLEELVLSFNINVNIKKDEFLTFPFRPVPLKATLFKKTYHVQDYAIPTKKKFKEYRDRYRIDGILPPPKLVYEADEQWEIGMEFHHRIPIGRLNFKTSIKVPLHGRTAIDIWSDQPVHVNMNYINSQEMFVCDQENEHKFSMLIGSTPFILPIR